MGKGKKGGKGGRVSMLGSNEPCNYNYQCETECCLEPKKRGKGKKGGKGGKGRKGGRDLQNYDGKDQSKDRYDEFMNGFGNKICVPEKVCDDDDVGYTIW